MADAAGELLRAWADQPAIDHHCHPLRRWPFQLSAVELRGTFTEALDPQLAEHHVIHTVAYQDAIRRIADQLQCDPNEAEDLRFRKTAGPGGYPGRLLAATPAGLMPGENRLAPAESF